MKTKENREKQNANANSTGYNPLIFSLAANPSLGESEKNFKVYSSYLREAFDEPTIRNIAVTGDYGIGKSSLIRWFESAY